MLRQPSPSPARLSPPISTRARRSRSSLQRLRAAASMPTRARSPATWASTFPALPVFVIKNMGGAGGKNATTYMATTSPPGRHRHPRHPARLARRADPRQDRTKVALRPAELPVHRQRRGLHLALPRPHRQQGQVLQGADEKEAVFGGDQIGSTTYDHSLMFRNLSNAKIKLITGYKGTVPARARRQAQGDRRLLRLRLVIAVRTRRRPRSRTRSSRSSISSR